MFQLYNLIFLVDEYCCRELWHYFDKMVTELPTTWFDRLGWDILSYVYRLLIHIFISFVEDKPLAMFLKNSKDLSTDERAEALGKDENIGWCIVDILKSSSSKAAKKLKKLSQTRAVNLERSDLMGLSVCPLSLA